MQYVYILQSENVKKVPATAKRAPLKLVHYEAFTHPKDAYEREQYLKTQWGRNYVRKALRHFFNS